MTLSRLLVVTLLMSIVAGCVATTEPVELTPEEGLTLLKEEETAVIIDVRSPFEFKKLHLENAININFMSADFGVQVDTLDHGGVYLLYCKSGARSGNAVEQMQAMGFERAYNIGGIDDLQMAGYPVVEEKD